LFLDLKTLLRFETKQKLCGMIRKAFVIIFVEIPAIAAWFAG
jgi:hypothetical protein